jgi:hypothetical protein
MPWTPLTFGKHSGKSLPQILLHDPDWFFYLWDKGAFEAPSRFSREAAIIHAKATSIRPTPAGAETPEVEYNFAPDGGCVGFDLVPASRGRHQGSTRTERGLCIDLSVPHRHRNYDKIGGRLFLRSLKACLFGSSQVRMTRERCEGFFDDADNFFLNDSATGLGTGASAGPRRYGN